MQSDLNINGEKSSIEEKQHISVCICTYGRPFLLKRVLEKLGHQYKGGLFSFTVIVADNDHLESARQTVAEVATTTNYPIIYCVEPEQNIAMARNKALENASGDFVAFIDDDEVPVNEWLYNLLKTCKEFDIDGVLGPVKPYFEHTPPQWVTKGKFFERPTHQTGYRMKWAETRSGNVLFKRSILNGNHNPFKREFGTGSEDVDFFRRMMVKGFTFVWSNEAIVFESVPPERCKRRYLLRLALLRGSNSAKYPAHCMKKFIKSFIALIVYTLALPVLVLLGHKVVFKYLIKLMDHTGRIFALLGLELVKKREV